MAEHQELIRLARGSSSLFEPRPISTSSFEVQGSSTYSYLGVYWNILVKRRWTLLTAVFVLETLVAIASFKMQPIYEATARLEIEAEAPPIQSLNDLYRSIPSDDTFLETQRKVLGSDNLAWQTIQQLDLRQNPEFIPSHRLLEGEPGDSSSAAQASLIHQFIEHLRVELVRNSRVLEVSFESRDPSLAAHVVNALVSNYLEYNFHKKYDATRKASEWMEQQLDELKAKVEKSQQAMVDYERQNVIVNINDKQNVVEQKLQDLNKELTQAQSDRIQKESLCRLVNSKDFGEGLVAQSELLDRLKDKYADLRGRYVDALGQYGPNFPKVARLRGQLNEMQLSIELELRHTADRIRNDYTAALGRETLLTRAVAEEKQEIAKLNQLLIQHNLLKREFETNQQLYENLLQRLKDATVSAGLRATNINVIDSALVPTVPVRPKKLLNMFIGLMVGLVLGATVAFGQESFDNSVKSAEDIEQLIATPALALIPEATSIRPRSPWRMSRGGRSPAPEGRPELAVVEQPASPLAEAYRGLRTSILLSTAPQPPQALLLTSTQPLEGKTSTSLNLALVLAQRGSRVLIIDGDLRKPRIGQALAIPESKGLSSLLTGANCLDEVLQPFGSLPNLWVLPAGPLPPNPADLLSSASMATLLKELRRRFEHIVLDSPPLLAVTDPTILSTLVDGVILVVESGVTARGALLRAHRILENAGGRILGTVLNKVDLRHNNYYGYYGHAYYRSDPNEELVSPPLEAMNSSSGR